MAKVKKTYKELETISIPEPIPELGIEAGKRGTIHSVYNDGRSLFVEISREDGTTIGFVDLDLDPEPHVVAYSP